MAVDGARGREEPIAAYGSRMRPDYEVDAVRDARISGAPDSGDPAILDADVSLHDTQRGVDDDRADHHGVQLAGARRGRLRHAQAEVLGVAPDRLVAGRLSILVDLDPEVRVAEADPIPELGPEARPTLRRREPIHAPRSRVEPSASPPNRTRVTVTVSPAAQRCDEPASRSRRKPRAARRSNSSLALTWSNGKCDDTRTARREVFVTASSRRRRPPCSSRCPPASSGAGTIAPGPTPSAGRPPPSGSTSEISRIPPR